MKPSPTYFFFFLLLAGTPGLYGQEAEKTPPVPPSANPSTLLRVNAQGLRAGGNNQRFNEVNGEMRACLDSLQSKLYSLKTKAAVHLAEAEEKAAEIALRIDSLGHNLQGFENLGGLRVRDKLGLGEVKVLEI